MTAACMPPLTAVTMRMPIGGSTENHFTNYGFIITPFYMYRCLNGQYMSALYEPHLRLISSPGPPFLLLLPTPMSQQNAMPILITIAALYAAAMATHTEKIGRDS